MLKINEEFCFNPQKRHSISLIHAALAMYAKEFEREAVALSGKLPIFLDTNVILGYYGMAQKEKVKLLAFFETNKERIYLTRRVEEEFLKNRINAIRKDFFKPLNEIIEDYRRLNDSIINSLRAFKETKKKILENDFPQIWEKLSKLEEKICFELESQTIEFDIKSSVSNITQENNNIELIDNLLELCSKFKVLEPLDISETEFLMPHYDQLLKNYKECSKIEKKASLSFPGCGEKKVEGREGDFIIFHEIIKYMKINNTSCVFLTNDTKKADWLQENHRPFTHYIENAYSLTERVMLIVHAETALKNISFENVHRQSNEYDNPISSEIKSEVNEIIEDFIETTYADSECSMRMVLAGDSIASNLEYHVYYHPENRGFRKHSYIGLYQNKSIRAIGKITNIVNAYLNENGSLVVLSSSSPLKEEEEERIKGSIEYAYYEIGWDISKGHLFFCVEKFYPTNFIKASMYAPMGTKFFDLKKILNLNECRLDTFEIAKLLNGKQWT